MNLRPFFFEFIKLAVLVFGCVALGLFVHLSFTSGLIAVVVALLVYILMIGFKLYRTIQWLEKDVSDAPMSIGSGVTDQLINLIYLHKKNLEKSYLQQKIITQQVNDIIAAIPSGTVILNENHEIEWANYPALLLLGIDNQKDIGVKIETLIRQADFCEQLTKINSKGFEVSSPVDERITLSIQVAEYARHKKILFAHNISPHIDVQRSRKMFIANASHELRTPLTVISGYLEFIQGDESLPDSLKMPVDKAVEQAGNMQTLIRDLLLLSALENKSLKAENLTHIQVSKHLKRIMQTLHTGAKAKEDYEWVIDVDKDLFIYAVEEELNSVCYNLIHNAMKYSEKASVITVSWSITDKQKAVFSVADQGMGISPEHIKHLGERFYRIDSGRSRRVGGTGLGLSIVKHIVERHHGKMEIHSRLGEGSTFSVTLPLNPLKDNQHIG